MEIFCTYFIFFTIKDGNFAIFSEMMSVSLCNSNLKRNTDYY